MAANSWALACLCITLGQTPNDVLITRERGLSVPVNIQDARRRELKELVLYSSSDQGRTWQQVAAMPPSQDAFTFVAPIDGVYWLRVATINLQGKQEPDNLYQPGPMQKVVIDTMKPLLRIGSAARQGDDVTITWSLQEDHPEWSTFKVEYQPKEGGATWTPVAATAGLTGQARFRPAGQGPIVVRLSLRDQAGNQGLASADVAGTIVTAGFTTPQTNGSSTAPIPAPVFPPVPPAPMATAPMPTTPPAAIDVPPPAPLIEAPKLPAVPQDTQKTFPMNPTPAPPTPWTGSVPPPRATEQPAGKVVASSAAPPPPNVAAPAAPAQRSLSPIQYVNHPEVTLEYELARVGPSGVGAIDLWWTLNDGQTWELYAVDPEPNNGSMKDGRYKRTLQLPGDGMFGFRLIVKSKAGLGKAPPKPGDAPDIRVEVDTREPLIELYGPPKADPQKSNTLLLEWNARDTNLTNTPIILEWSAKREGPWHAIAAPLPNTGRHSWTLPDNLPVQVYLRARAKDLAGNEGVAVTPNPQLVDLSEPEGRVINVSVSPR